MLVGRAKWLLDECYFYEHFALQRFPKLFILFLLGNDPYMYLFIDQSNNKYVLTHY